MTPELPGYQVLPPLSPSQPLPQVPSSEKFIVVDAGHGGEDPGTQGNGLIEKNGTLPIAKSLAKELEIKGYKVLMTRSDDSTVSRESRAVLTNSAQRHCFISIHLNHSDSAKSTGIETYYGWPKRFEIVQALRQELKLGKEELLVDDRGRLLAELVQKNVLESSKANDREVRNNPKLLVLNSIAAPSILVECGFVSSKSEKANLTDPDYQQKLGKGIADGIEEFLKLVEANPSYGINISSSPTANQ